MVPSEDPRQQFRRYLAAQYGEGAVSNAGQAQALEKSTQTKPVQQSLPATRPLQAQLPPTRPLQTTVGVTTQHSYRQPAVPAPGPGTSPGSRQAAGNPPSSPGAEPRASRTLRRRRTGLIYLARGALIALIAGALVLLCAVTILFYQYYQIASQLPTIGDLQQRASQFETTRIFDREGNVLYEILDPNAGRRSYVTLDKISPYLVAAVIATEDKDFYSHPGFDILAIGRAFWQNYRSGETVSGASTITQQLARNLLFSPEERNEQSLRRKVREAILAAEITRRYSKDKILELYLNEFYFGNLAYGVQAAAETYFNTSADRLTLGQSAFLAGLLQAPSIYDVYTNPEAVFQRQQDVLVLMYQLSQEQGCIYVSNSDQRVCLDPAIVIQASDEIRNTQFTSPGVQMRYPHWVHYIRSLLETQFDPQTIYRSGLQVYTTLDPALQDEAQNIVKQQVDSLKDKNAGNGSLVAVRPSTGEILAMVGSADFNNEAISGQVNMAISPRQPGSAIKPLTYLAAFEKGWTPGTLIWDVASEFSPSGRSDDPSPVYKPVNYDGEFHGPVTVRTALANSYNIPAVKALEFVNIYDDPNTAAPDGFINFASRMGITTLNRPDYGLSLTLGGGEVTLLDMTTAFATIANDGRRMPPLAITRILDHTGNVIYEYQLPAGDQVIRPEHAYLMSSILSDNEARTPMFGRNSVLNLPFPAAAKTGTTDDFRDNWTIGFSPDLAVGTWVGNADNSPMQNTTGVTGAAPIWSQFMQFGVSRLTGNSPAPFQRPGGIMDQVICAISGTLPSEWCPEQRMEIFAGDQPPLPADQDLWQKAVLDTWTGLRSSQDCPDFTDTKMVLNVSDPWAKKWIRKDAGQKWAQEMGFEDPIIFAPQRECRADDPRPKLAFAYPQGNDTITNSPLDIYILADATDWFESVRLDYGLGDDPKDWTTLAESNQPLREPDIFASWDVRALPAGRITLRLTLHSTQDTYAETFLHLDIQVPTPTPTPTETPLPTLTPTLTPTETPTETPAPSPTIIWFPIATEITLPVPP